MGLIICEECGKEMSDSLKKCPHCGFKRKRGIENKNKIFGGIKRHLKLIICVLVVIVVVGVASGIIIAINNTPTKRIERYLASEDYDSARTLYDKEIASDEKKAEVFKNSIISQMQDVKEKYVSGKTTYDETKKELAKFDQFDFTKSEFTEIMTFINKLESSRSDYKSAEEYAANGDLYNALKKYKSVSDIDSNYSNAQSKMVDLVTQYKSECISKAADLAASEDYSGAVEVIDKAIEFNKDDIELTNLKQTYSEKQTAKLAAEKQAKIETAKANQKVVLVDEPYITVQSDRWKALYPDMIMAPVKNNSDQTVKSYVVGFLAWDANGYPVKLEWNTGLTSAYLIMGTGSDANILPGETYGYDKGWGIDEDCSFTTIKGCIKSVTFYDGTTWNNDYYNYWIEEYKEKPLK